MFWFFGCGDRIDWHSGSGDGEGDGDSLTLRLSSSCETNSAELRRAQGNCWLSLRSLWHPLRCSVCEASEERYRPVERLSLGRMATICRYMSNSKHFYRKNAVKVKGYREKADVNERKAHKSGSLNAYKVINFLAGSGRFSEKTISL